MRRPPPFGQADASCTPRRHDVLASYILISEGPGRGPKNHATNMMCWWRWVMASNGKWTAWHCRIRVLVSELGETKHPRREKETQGGTGRSSPHWRCRDSPVIIPVHADIPTPSGMFANYIKWTTMCKIRKLVLLFIFPLFFVSQERVLVGQIPSFEQSIMLY